MKTSSDEEESQAYSDEKDLFAKLSDVMGMNNVLNASQSLIDNGNIDLLKDMVAMGNTDIELWSDLLGAYG